MPRAAFRLVGSTGLATPSLTVSGDPDRLVELAIVVGDITAAMTRHGVDLQVTIDAFARAPGSPPLSCPAGRRLLALVARTGPAADAIGAFAGALSRVDQVVGTGSTGLVVARQADIDRLWDGTEHTTAIGLLPDGQRLDLAAFEALGASERLTWLRGFLETTADPNHPAIAGMLAYLADSSVVRGDDPEAFAHSWWSVADAAVLLVLQDGWLLAHGVDPVVGRFARPGDPHHQTYTLAVEAWAEYTDAAESGHQSDEELLVAWAAAEELGVRHGEAVVEGLWANDPTFVAPTAAQWDLISDLAPGTHAFRLSILTDTEREFLASLVRDAVVHTSVAAADAMVVNPTTIGVELAGSLAQGAGERLTALGRDGGGGFGSDGLAMAIGRGLDLIGTGANGLAELGEVPVEFVASQVAELAVTGFELVVPDGWEESLAEALVDPTVVAPHGLRVMFDAMLGTDRAGEGLSFAYYLPMLIERGIVPPLPRQHVGRNGVTHDATAPRRTGPLRPD